tara:strand:+ start:761 stop:2791 length:2031 start_codon:yes stop_codon:yes gene_type:complete
MANYNKQFNFRNGVQVDNDNLVVSPTGLVGIGTTIPTESLDVADGNAKISGFATAASLYSRFLEVNGTAGVTTVTFTDAIGAGVSISSGIITAADPATGIVTYYGDARFLQGMPTSQWVDIDAGLGYISIYAQGNVGVGTVDPRFTFQVGGNADNTLTGFGTDSDGGVGICSSGNVLITGITTSGTFVGIGSDIEDLDASRITYGTISNDRLPLLENSKIPNDFVVSGIITAATFNGNVNAGVVTATTLNGNIIGDVTGTASTALSLSGTPNVIVGVLTANAVAASSFIGGITGDVTGNLTGTATTASSLTSDGIVDIEQANIGLTTVTSLLGIGTDHLTGSIEVGGTDTPNVADLFINRAFDRTNSGLTTDNFRNATVKLWSDLGESNITIGTSESSTGANGRIRYGNRNIGFDYSTPNSFDFINYGDGNINTYLQAGTSGIDTGSVYWHDKNDVMMALTYEGNLGIGLTDPTYRLHVNGDSRFTGDVEFDGNATFAGSLSVSSIASELIGNVTGNVTGNVDGSAGISTFNDISVTQIVSAGQIGITTEVAGLNRKLAINDTDSLFVVDTSGRVGVRTDSLLVSGINAPQATISCGSIGVATDRLDTNSCAVDFGQVGSGYTSITNLSTREFMRVPRVTAAQIAAFTGLIGGEIVYDTDNNVHKGYNGTTWNNLY